MKFSADYLAYHVVKTFGLVLRSLPICVALAFGRFLGTLGYYFNRKHKSIAYANLKVAFSKTKDPQEIKRITKKVFQNFGQNLIEIFHLPLIQRFGPEGFVDVQGRENVFEALGQKKGVILLAMHFGSWEISSLMSTILGHPYKVIVKPQEKFSKLDELLNSYRQCGGSVVIARGRGTREVIESLQKNEIVGIVVDQGGRDGVLVKFFGRNASMSVGAIRMGLKLGVPICFSILIHDKAARHRLVIDSPLELINTGDADADVKANVNNVIKKMEPYIEQYPAEYMWFYKIWKYSNESRILILNDGKVGHLRQSQTLAKWIQEALQERNISSDVEVIDVEFKNKFSASVVKVLSVLFSSWFSQGRIGFLRHFLTKDSFKAFAACEGDFVVSCGSATAGLNCFLSKENRAKGVCILKPDVLSFSRFHLVVVPQHDVKPRMRARPNVAVTHAAPNLITQEYLDQQTRRLVERSERLKDHKKLKIGVLLGGDTKVHTLGEERIGTVMREIKEAADNVDAELLVTTSRRTPSAVEVIVKDALQSFDRCRLLIIANRNNVPEAVGGILGLSDIIVVSGDSISMVSEAISSGKSTIVFPAQPKDETFLYKNKHKDFVEQLSGQGYIISGPAQRVGQMIRDVAKNRIRTRTLDDNETIFEAVKRII